MGWGWGWLLRQGAQHCLEKVPWKLPWEQVPGAREGKLQTLARKICAGGASLHWYLQGKIRRVGMCTPHSILIRVRTLHSYHVLKNHQWHRCSSLSREVELGWNQTLPTHCRSGKACSKCHLLVTQPPCPQLQLEASIFCCFREVRGSNSSQECCSWTSPLLPVQKPNQPS